MNIGELFVVPSSIEITPIAIVHRFLTYIQVVLCHVKHFTDSFAAWIVIHYFLQARMIALAADLMPVFLWL